MKRYLTYFDLLGFSDFIKNNEVERQEEIIIEFFKDIERALSKGEFIETQFGMGADLSNHKLNSLNFSDTVIFWTQDDSLESLKELLHVTYIFNYCATLFRFPARGSTVYGEIVTVNHNESNVNGGTYNVNSILGKGLVHAYEIAEETNWSGAIIDNSIIERLIELNINTSEILNPISKEYNVPIKKDRFKKYYAFDLIYKEQSFNKKHFDNHVAGITDNFSRYNKSIEADTVKKKIENTIKFLCTYIN